MLHNLYFASPHNSLMTVEEEWMIPTSDRSILEWSSWRRRFRRSPVWLGVMMIVVACGAQGQSPSPGASNGDEGTATGGDLTVAVGTLGTMEWAPATSGHDNELISMNWSNSLISLNDSGEYVGEIASSWELSEDLLTWTFELKPDVPFHGDWGTVTAEDVRFTWQEWMSEESTHDSQAQLAQAVGGDIANFEIIDDLTFTVTAEEPVIQLPSVLCSCVSGLQIASARYNEEQPEEAATHPIGTGPWEFVSSTPGVEVVLDAVQDHWVETPGFSRLIMKEIPDPAARLVQVQSGAVDIASLAGELVGEADAADLEIISLPLASNAFVILGGSYWTHPDEWLDRDAPWIQADDPEAGKAIREALSLAIDRDIILETILSSQGEVAYGPLIQYNNIPSVTDPAWDLPVYDPEQAREKLAEGGYPDGFEIELFQYPDDVDLVGIGTAIAGMWEEIGVTVSLRPADEAVLDEMLNQVPPQTDGIAWVKIAKFRPEPADSITGYTSSRDDDYKFTHPELDAAYDAMATEPDFDARMAIARDLISTLRDDTIIITLFNANIPYVVGPRVGSWTPAFGNADFNSLYTAQPAD